MRWVAGRSRRGRGIDALIDAVIAFDLLIVGGRSSQCQNEAGGDEQGSGDPVDAQRG
jgi:hypothetical protein